MFPEPRLFISLFSLLVTCCSHCCAGHWKFISYLVFHFHLEEVSCVNSHLGPLSLGPHATENERQESFLCHLDTY